MPSQNLPQGTWIRSKVPVSDSGDWNEREAPAGAVGLIDSVDANVSPTSYSVVFFPSFVANFWDANEIEEDAEVLPAGHPDIPTPDAFDLASSVADIVAEGEVDLEEGSVAFPSSLARRIRDAAGAAPDKADAIRAALDGVADGDEASMTLSQFDALAELVGVGDRLGQSAEAKASPAA